MVASSSASHPCDFSSASPSLPSSSSCSRFLSQVWRRIEVLYHSSSLNHGVKTEGGIECESPAHLFLLFSSYFKCQPPPTPPIPPDCPCNLDMETLAKIPHLLENGYCRCCWADGSRRVCGKPLGAHPTRAGNASLSPSFPPP